MPALDTHQEEPSLQTLNAAAAVAQECFGKKATGLSSMVTAISPLLARMMMELARHREEMLYTLDSDEYIFCRDDSPMVVERVLGYDGKQNNPVCFHCQHRLADHRHDATTTFGGPLNYNQVRSGGGPVPCLEEGCKCVYFEPSYVAGEWE